MKYKYKEEMQQFKEDITIKQEDVKQELIQLRNKVE